MVYRPLFFIWQDDPNVLNEPGIRDFQFMIGHSLMGAPVIEKNQNQVETYFPKGTWYSLETGRRVASIQETPLKINVTSHLSAKVPLYLRGGHIVYKQSVEQVTRTEELGNIFELAVGLEEIHGDSVTRNPRFIANSTFIAIGQNENEELVEKCLKELDCRFTVSVFVDLTQKRLEVFSVPHDSRHDPEFLVDKVSLYGLTGLGKSSETSNEDTIKVQEDETRTLIKLSRPWRLKELRLSFEFEENQEENQEETSEE